MFAVLWIFVATFLVSSVGVYVLGLSLRKAGRTLLKERVQLFRQRCVMLYILVVCPAAVVASRYVGFASDAYFLAWPLLFALVATLGQLVGGRPVRRLLWPHGPSLGREVVGLGRGLGAFYVPWLLVLVGPLLVLATPWPWSIATAVALFVARIVLHREQSRWVRWVLGARPVEDVHGFAEIVRRSEIATPGIVSFGAPGGLTNALALPGRRPLVMFTNGALQRLDSEELRGVLAHELAHLEDFAAGRDRRAGPFWLVLAAIGLFGAVALDRLGFRVAFSWIWVAVFFVTAVWVGWRAQHHETTSDRRSVELCGGAEPLVRGLVALHEEALVPRRLSIESERSSSHPGLARRIADIRRAAVELGLDGGESAPALTMPDRSADDVEVLQLRPRKRRHGTCHLDAAGITFARPGREPVRIAYAELVELRVRPTTSGPELRAVERNGDRHRFAFGAHESAEVQSFLDRVDTRLAPAGAHDRGAVVGTRLGALCGLAVGLLLAIVEPIQIGVAFAIICAFALTKHRGRGTVAALGAMLLCVGVARGIGDVHWASLLEEPWNPSLVAMSIGLGLWLLRGARQKRDGAWRLPTGRPTRIAAWFAAIGVVWLSLQASGFAGKPFRFALQSWSEEAHFGMLLLVGAAAAYWQSKAALGLAAVLFASVVFATKLAIENAGSTLTRDAFASDVPVPPMQKGRLELVRMEDISHGWDPRVSPRAELLAVRHSAQSHSVRRFGETPVELEATELEFVDDDRVLSLAAAEPAAAQLELRRVDGTVVWSYAVPYLLDGTVDLSVAGTAWRVVVRSGGETVLLDGELGVNDVRYRRFDVSEADLPRWAVPFTEDAVVELTWRDERLSELTVPAVFAAIRSGWWRSYQLAILDTDPPRLLAATTRRCKLLEAPRGGRPVLLVTRRNTSSLWAIERGGMQPLFGGFVSGAAAWDGQRLWICDDDSVTRVDAASRLRAELSDDEFLWHAAILPVSENRFCICRYGERGRSRVAVYDLVAEN